MEKGYEYYEVKRPWRMLKRLQRASEVVSKLANQMWLDGFTLFHFDKRYG